MSLDNRAQVIHCDGENCEASTLPPVGLRVSLTGADAAGYRASGWVFIVGQGKDLHFCQSCTPRYLAAFRSDVRLTDLPIHRQSIKSGTA